MSYVPTGDIVCGGVVCSTRFDSQPVPNYEKSASDTHLRAVCVKGVPVVYIMADDSKGGKYSDNRKYYQLMVTKLVRFNDMLFATHIFERRNKKYRELQSDLDVAVAAACANRLGIRMGGQYLWPLAVMEEVGYDKIANPRTLLLARVVGMSSVYSDEAYAFDSKVDGMDVTDRFSSADKNLIYEHGHCIRVTIGGENYNVYRELVMLLPEAHHHRSTVVGHLVTAADGRKSIGPLTAADTKLAKENNFKIDYAFAKTAGVTLTATILVESARYPDYPDSDDDDDAFEDELYYGYHGDPYFTRKFFFPHMTEVPADYLELLRDKIRPLLYSGSHDEMGSAFSYYQTVNAKIIDVTAVDENGQEVALPHTSYFHRSDPDRWGENWNDPHVNVYQFTIKNR